MHDQRYRKERCSTRRIRQDYLEWNIIHFLNEIHANPNFKNDVLHWINRLELTEEEKNEKIDLKGRVKIQNQAFYSAVEEGIHENDKMPEAYADYVELKRQQKKQKTKGKHEVLLKGLRWRSC